MDNNNLDPNKVKKTDKQDRKSKNLNKDADYKLELANSIARNSKRVVRTYAEIENTVVYFIRWVSGIIDKFLFNQRFGKYAALILAVALYIAVNSDMQSANILASSGGVQIDNIPYQLIVNPDAFEVEIADNVKVVSAAIIGDVSDINLVKSQKAYKVVADLTGYTEGTHKIDLIPVDFSNRVSVTLHPSSIIVTIKKKTTASFRISSEYVNTNKTDSIYAFEPMPQLDKTEVFVKASQDTIDKIAYVKALIDVSGVTGDFEAIAPLVAYDQAGQKLDVGIFPETVKAQVKVSTPMKSVPIIIKPIGEIPGGNAIESISLDHSSVTIYAPNAVLADIDAITVEFDATTITRDSNGTYPITLPSGVTKVSVSKVNISIKVGKPITKVFDGILISYLNNDDGYRFSTTENKISVTVTGTKNNIDRINPADIKVYIDVLNAKAGNNQQFPLVVVGSNNLVSYKITDGRDTLTVNVVEIK